MKKLVLSKLITVMLLIGVTLTIFESYNFRKHGISHAIDKAISISEAVKNGLTSHMLNGMMDKRDIFLNSISQMKNVEDIWIVRGENVTKQYGSPRDLEKPRDKTDLEVLKTAKLKYELDESFEKTSLRVTIPYVVERNNVTNCLACHNVNYGDTLGAVSIVMDISDVRNSGIRLAVSIMIFTTLAILMVFYFANKLLKPHLEIIRDLSKKIKNISNGNFANVIQKDSLTHESENLVKEYNLLVNGLSTTFNDIDKKLNIFIGNQYNYSLNPLVKSQKIIGNLSQIYQFKKEIEIDNTKEAIYERLAQILKNKFHQYQFMFLEENLEKNSSTIVYKLGEADYCSQVIAQNPEYCRVLKSTNDVISVEDHKVCPCFSNDEKLYYCIHINISENSDLVINFVLNSQSQLDNLKNDIPLIKNYFLEAAPSLIVKHLLEELKARAFKDGLTSLYNRKFLDEHLTKLVPQALRENIKIGVLMLDMDHFKAVNDEYGHDIGDLVLKELARILKENTRESDLAIRYGGEEFVVLLVGVDGIQSALTVANKIRTAVSANEINVYAGNKLKKTVSIGLSMFPEDSTNFDLVMKNADIALYEAKSKGRNQVVRWEEKVEVELF